MIKTATIVSLSSGVILLIWGNMLSNKIKSKSVDENSEMPSMPYTSNRSFIFKFLRCFYK